MDLLQQNETNGGEKENRGIKRKRCGKKTRIQKVSGCALCETKESSYWFKNTETGERDICTTCYQKKLRAPPNGCVVSVWHWCTNTETGEIDICNTSYKQ